jgi:hypothetical protein
MPAEEDMITVVTVEILTAHFFNNRAKHHKAVIAA